MVERTVSYKEAGGRLDKYLGRYLKEAPVSFIYKMLRKKNITLNGKKAAGTEILADGDVVRLYLSDETVVKFGGILPAGGTTPAERELTSVDETEIATDEQTRRNLYHQALELSWPFPDPEVIFEDQDILILAKPVGVLSQGAYGEEPSINDWILRYLIRNGSSTEEDLLSFRPAVANRLDRNTSGLILAGKTLSGLQQLSKELKDRTMQKYYLTIVSGSLREPAELKGYLTKAKNHNIVQIHEKPVPDGDAIRTAYLPVAGSENLTLLKVHLITGKSHQIRAHLASIQHPILGDGKYGDRKVNEIYRKLGIHAQMLHSYEMVFPDGRICFAPVPGSFRRVLENQELTIYNEEEMHAILEFKGIARFST